MSNQALSPERENIAKPSNNLSSMHTVRGLIDFQWSNSSSVTPQAFSFRLEKLVVRRLFRQKKKTGQFTESSSGTPEIVLSVKASLEKKFPKEVTIRDFFGLKCLNLKGHSLLVWKGTSVHSLCCESLKPIYASYGAVKLSHNHSYEFYTINQDWSAAYLVKICLTGLEAKLNDDKQKNDYNAVVNCHQLTVSMVRLLTKLGIQTVDDLRLFGVDQVLTAIYKRKVETKLSVSHELYIRLHCALKNISMHSLSDDSHSEIIRAYSDLMYRLVGHKHREIDKAVNSSSRRRVKQTKTSSPASPVGLRESALKTVSFKDVRI